MPFYAEPLEDSTSFHLKTSKLSMSTKRLEQPCPEPSALSKLIEAADASGNPFSATTLQILHNLQHQHLWSSLQIHDISTALEASENPSKRPITSSPDDTAPTLISGIPPHRVYTHPDEQLYMLEQGLREDDLKPERLFVIPTAQGQAWSLRRMAAVFDAMSDVQADETTGDGNTAKAEQLAKYYERREVVRKTKEWGGKRVLLAMVDKGMGGEGTVVYYVVQEGEVKPRQN